MIKVLEKLGVSRDTRIQTETEVYKVAFWALLIASVAIGALAFAGITVGLVKAVAIILGA